MLGSIADAAIGIALRTKLPLGWMHVTAQLDVHFLGMVRMPGFGDSGEAEVHTRWWRRAASRTLMGTQRVRTGSASNGEERT